MTINRRPRLRTLEHILWDVKEPTRCSLRLGDVVPGVVVYFLWGRGKGGDKYGPQLIGTTRCYGHPTKIGKLK